MVTFEERVVQTQLILPAIRPITFFWARHEVAFNPLHLGQPSINFLQEKILIKILIS